MTPEQIATLAGTIGIPGVAFFILLNYVTKQLNGKLDRLTDAVLKNTDATDRLVMKLDVKVGN